MALTRRELLTGFFKPELWQDKGADESAPVLPDGKDIHLFQDICIAWGRGLCNRCEDICPENAILFLGMMNPRIIDSRCTLCNDCLPACPVDAIVVRKVVRAETTTPAND